MKEQIHELRTRIDGLAQLVKSLNKPSLIFAQDDKPIRHLSVDEMVLQIRETGKVILWNEQSPIQVVSGLNFLAESYKSLILSKAWLGKVLAELGEETPYKKDGNRKTVEDIEPTADKFKVPELIQFPDGKGTWNDHSYIEKIDWLRQEIEIINKQTRHEGTINGKISVYGFIRATDNLTEARFHLGFELQRIKEQSK